MKAVRVDDGRRDSGLDEHVAERETGVERRLRHERPGALDGAGIELRRRQRHDRGHGEVTGHDPWARFAGQGKAHRFRALEPAISTNPPGAQTDRTACWETVCN